LPELSLRASCIILHKTDSTNTDAQTAARSGAPHGSVYFADEQLAGRGRGDHAWESAAGDGLYVSVLLRPRFPPFACRCFRWPRDWLPPRRSAPPLD
jgi:hypothetical protein